MFINIFRAQTCYAKRCQFTCFANSLTTYTHTRRAHTTGKRRKIHFHVRKSEYIRILQQHIVTPKILNVCPHASKLGRVEEYVPLYVQPTSPKIEFASIWKFVALSWENIYVCVCVVYSLVCGRKWVVRHVKMPPTSTATRQGKPVCVCV